VNDNDPVAADDAFTVAEGELFVSTQDLLDILLDAITVLANDEDLDLPADTLSVDLESVSDPEYGEIIEMNEDGTFIYQHDDSETTEDSFTYVAIDEVGHTSVAATVYITIVPVNDPLVANDDTATTDEDTPVSVLDSGAESVLENDEDPEGGTLTVVMVNGEEGNVGIQFTLPSGALLTLNTDGTFLYDPNGQFNYLQVDETATDRFTYRASDGEYYSNVATVTVTITGVNDAPETNVPVEPPPGPPDDEPEIPGSYTVDDSATVEQGETVTILDNGEESVLANDFDVEGDPLEAILVELVEHPAHASAFVLHSDGTFSYTHDDSETSTDLFVYRAYDGRLHSEETPVTILILPKEEEEEDGEGRVIISEIAWAGTAADSQDEWIELRNLGTVEVDLTGWTLRWRPKDPDKVEPEAPDWKEIELSGKVEGAPVPASEIADPRPGVRFEKRETDGVSWRVVTDGGEEENGDYFVLERRRDEAVSDVQAGFVYDIAEQLNLELSDEGEVIELVNAAGDVVDTANADPSVAGWVAGDAAIRATMERKDPLAEDTADNWHTNLGVVTHGRDAQEMPLAATAGTLNSPELLELTALADLAAETYEIGTRFTIPLELTEEEGRVRGWPWVYATDGIQRIDVSELHSGEYEGGFYWLEIDTHSLSPGEYKFLVVYGVEKTVLIPLNLVP
jgi:VCBS repeat-containing protein